MKTSLLLISIFISVVTASCVHYNTFPQQIPPNVASIGYEAADLYQLGNAIEFDPIEWTRITKVSFVLSSWAPYSEWNTTYTCSGYEHPITLQIYDLSLVSLYSKTQNFTIPWRPEPNPGCSSSKWMDSYGDCWSGRAFVIEFDVSDSNLVPQNVVYAITFNTQNNGFEPTGVPGPYNSLNLGLNITLPFVGENVNIGELYVNSTSSSTYGDSGPTNVLRSVPFDGYSPLVLFSDCECAVSFENVYEQTSHKVTATTE